LLLPRYPAPGPVAARSGQPVRLAGRDVCVLPRQAVRLLQPVRSRAGYPRSRQVLWGGCGAHAARVAPPPATRTAPHISVYVADPGPVERVARSDRRGRRDWDKRGKSPLFVTNAAAGGRTRRVEHGTKSVSTAVTTAGYTSVDDGHKRRGPVSEPWILME